MTARRIKPPRGAVALAAVILAAVIPSVGLSAPIADARPVAAPGSRAGAATATRPVRRSLGSEHLSNRLVALAAQASQSTTEPQSDAQNRIAGTLRRGPGSLNRAEGGRLVVNARVDHVDASTLAALRATGARVAAQSTVDRLVTLTVRARQLPDIAAVPGVEHLDEVLQPAVGTVDPSALGTALDAIGPITNVTCPIGAISEGDTQLGAATARTTFGINGAGVSVGILSDSYNSLGGAAADVSNGELPGSTNPCGFTTNVVVQSEKPSAGTDEGRAMAQIVHDLAPGATISFASGVVSDVDFANQIRTLANNGARVIVDDITYLDEPMYQDGIIAKAIDDVAALGVTYVSSAGNSNVSAGAVPIGSYETTAYRPTPCPASIAAFTYLDCHDFDTTAGTDAGDTVVIGNTGQLLARLGWNEPSYGIATNFDLFAIDPVSGAVLAASTDVNPTSNQKAYEAFAVTNSSGANKSYRLVVARKSTPSPGTPRFKIYLGRSRNLLNAQYQTNTATDTVGPSSYGHNMTPAMASVAATAYNSGTAPETFSSRGPVTYCWKPQVGTVPAAALPSCVSDTIDTTATDGVANSFFGQLVTSVWRFYGTSAAAPHAAALAALAIEARYCVTGIGGVLALRAGSTALAGQGADAVGGGLANASGSINGIAACTGVPTVPRAVSATTGPTAGSATVSWTAPIAAGTSAIVAYRVRPYINGVAQTPTTFNSTALSQTVTGLVNGTAYTFQVEAQNGTGFGGASLDSNAYTPTGPPGAPSGVQGTAGDHQVSLSWIAPASDGGLPITGYQVTPFIGVTAQTPQTFNSTATSQTITGLTDGVGYTFAVAAVNSAGTGSQSTKSAVLTPVGLPGAPTNLQGTGGDTVANLTWTAPASDGGSAITGYRIIQYNGGVPVGLPIDVGVVTSVQVGDLTNGTAYTFTVAATNAIGTGPASAMSASITAAATPSAPTISQVLPTDTAIQATWTTPASDGGSPITGYDVTVLHTSVVVTTVHFVTTATTQLITGLTNGQAYTLRVAGVNAIGTGSPSVDSPSVTPAAVPGSPTAVGAVAAPGGATVSWTAPLSIGGSAITGYRVTPVLGGVAQTPQVFVSTATAQLVTGLNGSTSYRFRVAAINAQGTSLNSALSAAVVTQASWAPFASWNALVTQLYTDLLGRAPTATELSARVGALNAKTLTSGGLVAALRTDPDHLNNVDPVTRLYRAYFLRIPDRPGLTFWIGKKRTGTTLNSISNTFAASAEFKTRYGTLTNQQFVELVYTNVLGRSGDAGGIAYWTGQLNTNKKTRGQVMVGFSESAEFKTKQVNKVGVSVLYILLLLRAPTSPEFADQTAALDGASKTVTRLAAELLASSTFVNRFP